MKAMKILLKVIVMLVALVVIALLLSPFWLGSVAKTGANAIAPSVLKTDFHIERLSINPYTGRLELDDLKLSNPQGYSEKYAASVGVLRFDLATTTLGKDVIHVEEITVSDVFVSIVKGGKDNVMNFTQIQYDMAGGKDKYEAAQAEKEARGELKEAKKEPKSGAEEKARKKFVIDRLTISGLKLKIGIVPISLPSITLTDIGKKDGGATLEDVSKTIADAVMKAAGAVGDGVKALGGLVGDTVKSAGSAVSDAAGKATDAVSGGAKAVTDSAKAVTDGAASAVGKTAEAVGGVAGKTTEAVGGVAGKTTEAIGNSAKAVGDGASKAINATTETLGNGVKAVGEGASKAADKLKGLFK